MVNSRSDGEHNSMGKIVDNVEMRDVCRDLICRRIRVSFSLKLITKSPIHVGLKIYACRWFSIST